MSFSDTEILASEEGLLGLMAVELSVTSGLG